MSETDRSYWDDRAASFDQEPDHGLGDARPRRAWRDLLITHLPPAPADVVDLGCGTGTLAVLLAQEGFRVRGLDFAPAMVSAARTKALAAGVDVSCMQGDAAAPPYGAGSCDVVLSRHVLWAMPDPDQALAAWIRLLRPAGRLVLVEGRWSTGTGITAEACEALVRQHRQSVEVTALRDPLLWGTHTDDERYLLLTRR